MKIKIRCNGPAKDVNEVDLDDLVQPASVPRSAAPGPASDSRSDDLPKRFVQRCQYCATGQVIITREIIEKARSK